MALKGARPLVRTHANARGHDDGEGEERETSRRAAAKAAAGESGWSFAKMWYLRNEALVL